MRLHLIGLVGLLAATLAPAALGQAPSTPAAKGALIVTVDQVRSGAGKIMVSLERGDGQSPPTQVDRQSADAKVGPMTFRFEGLAPGDYSVRLYHDENGDGQLNTNMLGLPREGFAFSNGVRATFGPPSFSATKVRVADEPVTTIAHMTY